MMTKEILKL